MIPPSFATLPAPPPPATLSMYTRKHRCLPIFHSTSTISSPSERATRSAAARIFSKSIQRLPDPSRSAMPSNRRQQKSWLCAHSSVRPASERNLSIFPPQGKSKILYSSSRLVTLCLSWVVFPTGDEFQWGEVGERLMRAHAVVGVLPTEQLTIQPWRLIGVGVYLIELFVVGAVRALHVRVQLRRLRREHEQRELFLLTGQLEFCGELAAAVDL